MSEAVEQYIAAIASKLKTGQAREHAYRPAFEALIKSLEPSLQIVNDPSRSEHGNPDFVFLRGDITAGYVETKDIGVDLDKTEKTQQMERYLGYSNLILTDYLEFRFFRNGERYGEPIIIGQLVSGAIKIHNENFSALADTLKDFLQGEPEPIKSGKRLAKIMGGKARRIRDNVVRFLALDTDKNAELERIYEVIKELLVHDLSKEKFADMYSQTLVYGLFVARFHDKTSGTFTRQEARDLVPDSNPFLQQFFDHIAGSNFDKRLGYIVNELCEVFSCTDIQMLMAQYFNEDDGAEGPDPVIHFYEDFLKEYDAEQRKKLGAFYTPLPVVRFIVRAVDSILEKEFNLPQGLADTEKVEIKRLEQARKIKEQVHRVQILDPAAGTGTFLNETVRTIHARFKDQSGRWKAYVNDDLLPRIHGFELMMAPYTIAHLKLGMMLKETGYDEFTKRLGVYLTNSLEEAQTRHDLFSLMGLSQAIADEARQASFIKKERPIMVVIGNPPYSGVSSNETEYANSLVEKYKIEPGGKQKLQERKHWLNDDYVKFIAFAEDMVEKNKEGIVGFITNHGYLDNPTFRGMRWHLMNTFDEIYVLDLHGNANKKEVSPDGNKDENIFAIQQGVAIMLAVKNQSKKKNQAKIYHSDLWGKRKEKFEELEKSSIENMNWTLLNPELPNLFFVQESSKELKTEYRSGFSIDEMLPTNTSGVVTMGDGFIVDKNKEVLLKRITKFLMEDIPESILKDEYGLGKNYAKWIIGNKKNITVDREKIIPFMYRPFDNRYTYFDNKLVWRPRTIKMRHFIVGKNIGIIAPKQLSPDEHAGVYVTRTIGGHKTFSAYNSNYYFPLYLYATDGTRVSNLNKEIAREIEKIVGFTTPEDIFDYTYAALHSPSYLEKYKEFLKIDFPRVPYPKDKEQFQALVALGNELRSLHLLESPKVNQFITTYPKDGSNIVEKPEYKDSNVSINKDQYFGNVPEVAWNFWIGGYQPAQKWLKDRKGSELSNADIEHYQQMTVALTETDRIMGKIDNFV